MKSVSLTKVMATLKRALPENQRKIITPDFVFDSSLGIDSLALISCMTALDSELGIEISENLLIALTSKSLADIFGADTYAG